MTDLKPEGEEDGFLFNVLYFHNIIYSESHFMLRYISQCNDGCFVIDGIWKFLIFDEDVH